MSKLEISPCPIPITLPNNLMRDIFQLPVLHLNTTKLLFQPISLLISVILRFILLGKIVETGFEFFQEVLIAYTPSSYIHRVDARVDLRDTFDVLHSVFSEDRVCVQLRIIMVLLACNNRKVS